MTPFPGYQRRVALMKKHNLTAIESVELVRLHRELEEHRKAHPDWDPNKEPLRVPLFDLARVHPDTRRR